MSRPSRATVTHTGGGLIDVASPAADTVIVTMSGAAIANSEMQFDLDQCFEVSFDDPKVKKAKISVEGRVVGLLRGECKGCAEYTDAAAHIVAARPSSSTFPYPLTSVCGCTSLGVNDHDGPRRCP